VHLNNLPPPKTPSEKVVPYSTPPFSKLVSVVKVYAAADAGGSAANARTVQKRDICVFCAATRRLNSRLKRHTTAFMPARHPDHCWQDHA